MYITDAASLRFKSSGQMVGRLRASQASWVRTLALPSWLALPALLAVAAAVGLFSLLRTPAPDVDEAWNANRAWALLQSGQAFGTMDAGVFDKFDGYGRYFPWLGTFFHAVAISVGGPSLLSVRLTSLIFGLVLLVAIYTIALHLSGRRVALASVFLVSLSQAFLYSSHLGRHDIMVAALGYGAVALHVADPSKQFSVKSVLSGLAIGASVDIHLNAVIFGPVVAVLHLHDHGWSILATLRSRRLWGFALGTGGGLGYFIAMHLLPDAASYFALAALGPAPSRVPPLLTLNPGVWLESVIDLNVLVAWFGHWRLPLVIAGLAVLGRRRSAGDVRLITLFAVLYFMFLAVIRNKVAYYAILISPLADIVAAAFAMHVLREIYDQRRRWITSPWPMARVALVIVLLIAAVTSHAAPVFTRPTDDYQTALQRISEVIPPGSTVMGPQTYWFALPPEQRYLSWEQLLYFRRYSPESTIDDAFGALRPDFFIIDQRMEYLSTTVADLYLPTDELNVFLKRQAQTVTTVENGPHGVIQIYKIDWGSNAGQ